MRPVELHNLCLYDWITQFWKKKIRSKADGLTYDNISIFSDDAEEDDEYTLEIPSIKIKQEQIEYNDNFMKRKEKKRKEKKRKEKEN